MIYRHTVLLAVCLFCFPAFGDDMERANRLLVETASVLRAVERESSADKRLDLLKRAETNLKEIVERYPSTDLAVKLSTGQAIGNISLPEIKRKIAAAMRDAAAIRRIAERKRCYVSPDFSCLIARALAHAKFSKDVWAYNYVAYAQTKAGDRTAAIKTLSKALELAQKKRTIENRVRALFDVAEMEILAGDRAATMKSLEIAKTIIKKHMRKRYYQRTQMLTGVAKLQTRVGARTAALATLQSALVRNRSERGLKAARLVSDIAIVQIRAGDREAGLETLKAATDIADSGHWVTLTMRKKLPTYAYVASAKAEAGQHDWAVKTAAVAGIDGLLRLGKARLKADDKTGVQAAMNAAVRKAGAIKDRRKRVNVLSEIALTFARAGWLSAASATIQGTLPTLIEFRRDYCGPDLDLHCSVDDVERSLRYLAVALAESGDLSKALATAKQVRKANRKASALLAIADVQTRRGDHQGARNTVVKAMNASATWRSDPPTWVLKRLAMAHVNVNDLKKALSAVERLEKPKQRMLILRDIAVARIQAGDRTGASAAINKIIQPASKARALTYVASAQMEIGDSVGALRNVKAALGHLEKYDNFRGSGSLRQFVIWALVRNARTLSAR